MSCFLLSPRRKARKEKLIEEALNNSTMNYQSKKKIKCDFIFFFIFNGLSATENGNTCRNK